MRFIFDKVVRRTIVVLLCLSGCCEKSDETALILIDGKPLTASQVKEYVLIRARKAELAGKPIPAAEFADWANSTAMQMIGSIVNVRLMAAEIAKNGVEVLSEDKEKALGDLRNQTGKSVQTIEEMAALFGDLKTPLLEQYEFSVRLVAYARTNWTVEPPDEMVSQYMILRTNDFLRAQKIDDDARRNSEAAYARLQRGEKWEVVAADCSEDKLVSPGNAQMAKEWCWMTEDALGLKPIARVLCDMKVGEYTKPLDTKAGMLIIRLLEKNGRLYRVARMMFRMAEPVDVPENASVARAQLAEQMFLARRKATLERLLNAAHVEYPLGTNFTYKIWK